MVIHAFLDRITRLLVNRMVAAMGNIRISISLFTLNCKFREVVGFVGGFLNELFLEKVHLVVYPYVCGMVE